MKPTLFVDVRSLRAGASETNPLEKVIPLMVTAFGCLLVSNLVGEGNVEADIALVRDPAKALDFLKQTEKTIVVVFLLEKHDQSGAESLVRNYPNRVRVFEVLDFVAKLVQLVGEFADKKEGDSGANPAP